MSPLSLPLVYTRQTFCHALASKHSLACSCRAQVLKELSSLVWDVVLLSCAVLVAVCCCEHWLSLPVLPCPLVFLGGNLCSVCSEKLPPLASGSCCKPWSVSGVTGVLGLLSQGLCPRAPVTAVSGVSDVLPGAAESICPWTEVLGRFLVATEPDRGTFWP